MKVNGNAITLGDKAEYTDKITVDGKTVRRPKRVYIAFHKPVHCVTAVKDDQHKTVMDYIKMKERIFPIGRLDYNTSGLLLLTNDGDFANMMMHPRYELKKTYRVWAEEAINDDEVAILEGGIDLEDGKTRPAKVFRVDTHCVDVRIHEGKNRIIRRMFKALNHKVKKLQRIKYGTVSLRDLPEKKHRPLSREEVEGLLKSIKKPKTIG